MNALSIKRPTHTTNTSESHQRILDFLNLHHVAVLATVDPNNDPHATAVYYAVDENFTITFVTKRDTKKHDNIQHNSHVQMVIYEPSSQTTVQIKGIAEDISYTPEADDAHKGMVRAAMQTSESGVAPISKLFAGSYVAYRIKPVQIRMAVFMRPDPGGYDIYETIDF